MKRADLHTHSVYSDGKYHPDEICKRAKFYGVEVLSITDHDTMNGLAEKRLAAEKYGISYVDGWEISSYEQGERVHVLGYGCQLNEAYHAFMQQRVDSALARAKERIHKLNKAGVPITLEEVLALQVDKASPLHTMHVARALAKRLNLEEGVAYVRYLERGMLADSDIGRPTPLQAIECIHAAGGVAFLAHPGRIRLEESVKEQMIHTLKDHGLDGIECHYSTHTVSQTERYLALAQKYDLKVSGGSDMHWEDGARMIGSPVFMITEEFLAYLQGGNR